MLLLAARRATAQCPNGRPPPCQQGAAVARPKPADPLPIKANEWVVVPFSNVTKSADIDWLRDASVDLLATDLGRWTDVEVVPAKRVTDLVRERPNAVRAEPLSLNDGLAIARRAGAGRLVMGDFFKLGTGARIVASVFDAKTGAKIRTYTEEVHSADSLLTAFAPVARGVLAVAPPTDAHTGEIGTRSLAAYQEYLIGAKALDRYDLVAARAHLERALTIDSTFALAHYRYAEMLEYGNAGSVATPEYRRHALAAQRLGTTLPRRERTLIDAEVSFAGGNYYRTCEIANDLVARDSTDVQALFILGKCSFRDFVVDPSPPDSMVGRFPNSWNRAIWAFSRVIDIDPSYTAAWEQILEILQRFERAGFACPPGWTTRTDCVKYQAFVRRSGDSLTTVPARPLSTNASYFEQEKRALDERARPAILDMAQNFARRWVDTDSSSEGARQALAGIALGRGDIETADKQLRSIPISAKPEYFVVNRMRMEVAVKLGRGVEARAMFDTLVKAIPDAPSIELTRGFMDLMFGRIRRFDRGLASANAPLGDAAVRFAHEVAPALLGIPRPDLAAAESSFVASAPANCNTSCVLDQLVRTVTYALHVPTVTAAKMDSLTRVEGRFQPARYLRMHDTTRARRMADTLLAGARRFALNYSLDGGWAFAAAETYLAIGDTAAALKATRFFVDSVVKIMPITMSGTGPVLWPRAMLMRADLARAMGNKDEARTWYRRVLDLWADADEELKPTLDRIRAALAALDTKA